MKVDSRDHGRLDIGVGSTAGLPGVRAIGNQPKANGPSSIGDRTLMTRKRGSKAGAIAAIASSLLPTPWSRIRSGRGSGTEARRLRAAGPDGRAKAWLDRSSSPFPNGALAQQYPRPNLPKSTGPGDPDDLSFAVLKRCLSSESSRRFGQSRSQGSGCGASPRTRASRARTGTIIHASLVAASYVVAISVPGDSRVSPPVSRLSVRLADVSHRSSGSDHWSAPSRPDGAVIARVARRLQARHLLVIDLVGIFAAACLALGLRYDVLPGPALIGPVLPTIFLLMAVRTACNSRLGLYSRGWRFASIPDVFQIASRDGRRHDRLHDPLLQPGRDRAGDMPGGLPPLVLAARDAPARSRSWAGSASRSGPPSTGRRRRPLEPPPAST